MGRSIRRSNGSGMVGRSVGRSVGRWFCRSDSHKLGQKVTVSVSWLVHRIVNLSMVNVK